MDGCLFTGSVFGSFCVAGVLLETSGDSLEMAANEGGGDIGWSVFSVPLAAALVGTGAVEAVPEGIGGIKASPVLTEVP